MGKRGEGREGDGRGREGRGGEKRGEGRAIAMDHTACLQFKHAV